MEFEDNKINGHVPGQIVLNPDGTTSGATVPDARTAGEKVHATIGTVRAMSRTMLFARDIHHGDRASLIRVSKGMATPNDGDMIPATTHPEVVKGILRGDQATCSDTEWLNDPYKRGMWSRGTAYLDEQGRPQGWVRMPDLNQAKEGSLPPPFARGGADSKAGSIGKDTMRRIEAAFNNVPTSFNIRSGAFFTEINADSVDIAGSGSGHKSVNLKFDSSQGLPEGHTGTEFAPWHIYGVSYSITSNGVMNEGAIDAEQVMGEVLLVKQSVAESGLVVFDVPGVHTWVVPDVLKSGKKKARVTVTAGGGGANNSPGLNCGACGGAGGTEADSLDLTGIDTVSCTIGAGGIGSPVVNGFAGGGGSSSFGAFLSATGGQGAYGTAGGYGGEGVGGSLSMRGGDGSDSSSRGGLGGASYWGGGGRAGSGVGSPGRAPGSGGGGSTEGGTPGPGADGIITIEW